MTDETTQKTAEDVLRIECIKEDRDTENPLVRACLHEDSAQAIYNAMKEYARQVAEQVRAECAQKAKIMTNGTTADGIPLVDSYPVVDKDSILSVDIEQFII